MWPVSAAETLAKGWRRTGGLLLILFSVALSAGALLPTKVRGQHVADGTRGRDLLVRVPVPQRDLPRGSLRYAVQPSEGVKLLSAPNGSLKWSSPATNHEVSIVVLLRLPADQPSGTSHVALLRIVRPSGSEESIPIQVRLEDPFGPAAMQGGELPAVHTGGREPSRTSAPYAASGATEGTSAQIGGLGKEVEVELYGSTRTASPGGLVTVRYTVFNWEDTDERVRLRIFLPEGWKLLDSDFDEQEILITAEDYELEGELRVVVPADAKPGERHHIYMLAEVVGEPGGAAVFSRVQITRRGGLKPGQAGLTGSASAQATQLEAGGFDLARYGGTADLSGSLTPRTTLSLSYQQGPREVALTNYRIAQEDTRWNGNLRSGSLNFQFGNQINSSGTVLTGPFVRGQGVSMRRTEGRFIGDFTVAQPTSYTSDPGGLLLRGSAGIRGSAGRLLVVGSDFSRPVGGYSTAPRYPQDIDPDSLAKLELERTLAERAPSNRVFGGGVEAELQHAKVHRLSFRGGMLRLTNAAGDSSAASTMEAQYAFNHRRASFSARWSQMPPSLPGIYIPGNDLAADATVKLVGEVRVTGRAYRNLSETVGNSYRSEGEGTSAGLRYMKQGRRMEVRANRRQWSYGQEPTVARTITASLGLPVGPLAFSVFADIGEQQRDTLRQPTASYRADLRWNARAGSAAISGTYFESLIGPPRMRTDVLGSRRLGDWELSGGAWATKGWQRGGEPGLWTQIGVPISYDLLLVTGIEHAPPSWGQTPRWLGTLGIRTKLSVPLPFLPRGGGRASPGS